MGSSQPKYLKILVNNWNESMQKKKKKRMILFSPGIKSIHHLPKVKVYIHNIFAIIASVLLTIFCILEPVCLLQSHKINSKTWLLFVQLSWWCFSVILNELLIHFCLNIDKVYYLYSRFSPA